MELEPDHPESETLGRARRLKTARILTGLSRKEFCKEHDFSLSTLEAWESGRNPLTLKGAKKVVDCLKSSGIYCSVDWIMEEVGLAPRTLVEMQSGLLPAKDIPASANSLKELFDPEIVVLKEAAYFRHLNPYAHVALVVDDAMEPYFSRGDYVGGIYQNGLALKKLFYKTCIVTTKSHGSLVRKFLPGSQGGLYTLASLNHATTVVPPVLYDIEVSSAASVIWHRKPSPTL